MQRTDVNCGACWGIGADRHQDAEQAGALQQRHLLVDAVGRDIERRTKVHRRAEIDRSEVGRAIAGHQVERGIVHLRRWLGDVVEVQGVAGFARDQRRGVTLEDRTREPVPCSER